VCLAAVVGPAVEYKPGPIKEVDCAPELVEPVPQPPQPPPQPPPISVIPNRVEEQKVVVEKIEVAPPPPQINPKASIKVEKRISAVEKYDILVNSVRLYGGIGVGALGMIVLLFVMVKCVSASDCWNEFWSVRKRKTSIVLNDHMDDNEDTDSE
jgi:hypothetical protein